MPFRKGLQCQPVATGLVLIIDDPTLIGMIEKFESEYASNLIKKYPFVTLQPKIKILKARTCDSCGKSFSNPYNLQRHINAVHEGRRDFICNICKKAYPEKRNLQAHISTVHERCRDHRCKYCDKTLASNISRVKSHWLANDHNVQRCTHDIDELPKVLREELLKS